MTPVEFIDSLCRHFAKRHESEHARMGWLREMVGVVHGTDSRVLAKAYELIRDGHEERAFPLPATLKRHLAHAAEIVYPERHTGGPSQPDQRDWTTRTAHAERLMAETDLGQQAARDGWANGMREFIAARGRLPHEHEIGRLVDNAVFVDRCATGHVDLGIAHDGLVILARRLVDRRNAIAARVKGSGDHG